MKITFIGTDLSLNGISRTYFLAKVLSREHEVEIVGATSRCGGHDIWPPIDTGEVEFKPIYTSYKYPAFLKAVPKIFRAITGDVVYAQSLQLPSFGLALVYRAFHGTPVIVDSDDWEFSRKKGDPPWTHYIRGNRHIRSPSHKWLMEKLAGRADGKTCTNSLLQKRFGGDIIVHSKDTDFLDPEQYNGTALKEKLGLKDKQVILFMGTPRPHKGLEDLIEAVKRIDRKNVVLVFVGVDFDDPITQTWETLGSTIDLRLIELQPHHMTVHFLAMADVVAIPQKRMSYAMEQVPSKLFDAMAMARPIVTTRVSDIEKMLDGRGWVVDPDSPKQLASAIEYILDNPTEAKSMGKRAREKCIAHYSWNTAAPQLEQVIRAAMSNGQG